jgi:hypothetical protein
MYKVTLPEGGIEYAKDDKDLFDVADQCLCGWIDKGIEIMLEFGYSSNDRGLEEYATNYLTENCEEVMESDFECKVEKVNEIPEEYL